MDRGQQVTVGQLATVQVRRGVARPEEAAERRQAQLRTAGVRSQLGHDEAEGLPEVGVTRPPQAARHLSQARRRVVRDVTLLGRLVGRRVDEQVPVLRDEEEEQAVDHPEELSVVTERVEITRAE